MEKHIKREIQKSLLGDFFKGKIIIIAGARQVGKTTLVEAILKDKQGLITFNADNPTDREKLEKRDLEQLISIIGDAKIIFIDEAQKVVDIGNTLKLLVDHYGKEKQIIATGSSSLNLLSNTSESLTGRKYVYELYSLSVREICSDKNTLRLEKELSDLLVYGTYPEIYLSSIDNKQRLLTEIASSYLYQDILELEQVRNPETLNKLLSAIALQIGSEVSLSELGKTVNLDLKTVERYIDLLEKNYVLFRLPPYYTNQRKTLSKLNKIYFYDLGIRNALINNFNRLDKRNDVGSLWENFIIVERMKLREYGGRYANQYFWKTYDGSEIDLVEQVAEKLNGYEIKWGRERTSPKSWLEYPNSSYEVVNRENFKDFLEI
jgi:uncharacterized protein